MAVKLIFKKKVIVFTVRRMASSLRGSEVDLQKRKKGHHDFSLSVLVRMAVHMDQYFSTLFGMQTRFQTAQTSVAHSTYVVWPINGPWPTG